MRYTRMLAAVLAAATVTTAALAATAIRDPLRLALQRADMPANTRQAPPDAPSPARMNPAHLTPLGVRGLKGASYAYKWPAGGTVATPLGPWDKEWYLSGDVFAAPDLAGARKLFDLGKRARTGFFSDFPDEPTTVRVTLPAYGDQQFALYSAHRAGLGAMVFVRKGTVVWQLRIAPIPRQFRPTKAQVLAVLRTYAAKQKTRVGAG
jgi:hypothetical protein